MTKHSFIKICFALTALAFAIPAKAWGPDGHKLVAKIANTQLKANIKDSVAYYLKGETLDAASTWMDDIKSDKSYDFQKPWHYINIDKDSTYRDGDTGTIVWEIKRVINELKHRQNYSRDRVQQDIRILIHLMGDLHQPLHVGYAVDQGGNTIQVYYAANATNLHRVWDSEIIHDAVLGHGTEWLKLSQFDKDSLQKLLHVDVVAWMNDSRALLPQAYDFKGNNLTKKYVDKNAPIIERQLLLGGLRLGVLFNQIFGS